MVDKHKICNGLRIKFVDAELSLKSLKGQQKSNTQFLLLRPNSYDSFYLFIYLFFFNVLFSFGEPLLTIKSTFY